MTYTVGSLITIIEEGDIDLTRDQVEEAIIVVDRLSETAHRLLGRFNTPQSLARNTKRYEQALIQALNLSKLLYLSAAERYRSYIVGEVPRALADEGHTDDALCFLQWCAIVARNDTERVEVAKEGIPTLKDELGRSEQPIKLAKLLISKADSTFDVAKACINSLHYSRIGTTRISQFVFSHPGNARRPELAHACIYESLNSFHITRSRSMERLARWMVQHAPNEERVPVAEALYSAFLEARHRAMGKRFKQWCIEQSPEGVERNGISSVLGAVEKRIPRAPLKLALNNLAKSLKLASPETLKAN